MRGAGSAFGCGIQEAVELLGLPVVALTRSLVGCTPVVAGPAHDDTISRVEVDQDPLSGRIMKSVDPDEESGEQVSLMAVPAVDRDACHTEWWETVVDDMVSVCLSPGSVSGCFYVKCGGTGVMAGLV